MLQPRLEGVLVSGEQQLLQHLSAEETSLKQARQLLSQKEESLLLLRQQLVQLRQDQLGREAKELSRRESGGEDWGPALARTQADRVQQKEYLVKEFAGQLRRKALQEQQRLGQAEQKLSARKLQILKQYQSRRRRLVEEGQRLEAECQAALRLAEGEAEGEFYSGRGNTPSAETQGKYPFLSSLLGQDRLKQFLN